MTAAHLDYEALADFAEGILDDDSATSAEEHLADCADCRLRAAEVAEVSRVLADAPLPPMPAHLLDRLDAAIAAEAASHVPVNRHARKFQLVAAAAAAVVLVGGGAVAVRTVMDDADSKTAAASQPPVEEPGRTSDTAPRPQAARSVPFTLVHSGTKYTAEQLSTQISKSMSTTASGHRPLAAVDDLSRGCVARVAGPANPLLVDSATYEGRPATVIVVPGTDATHVDVWVVGPKCSAGTTDLISHQRVTH